MRLATSLCVLAVTLSACLARPDPRHKKRQFGWVNEGIDWVEGARQTIGEGLETAWDETQNGLNTAWQETSDFFTDVGNGVGNMTASLNHNTNLQKHGRGGGE